MTEPTTQPRHLTEEELAQWEEHCLAVAALIAEVRRLRQELGQLGEELAEEQGAFSSFAAHHGVAEVEWSKEKAALQHALDRLIRASAAGKQHGGVS